MNERFNEAKALLASCREGFLGTLEGKTSFVSAVAFIYQPDEKFGAALMLLSGLARHTKNFLQNPTVSLLAIEPGTRPAFEKKRVTVQGEIFPVKDAASLGNFKKTYTEAFPGSAGLFEFGDFSVYEIRISEVHYIAGFGKIETFR